MLILNSRVPPPFLEAHPQKSSNKWLRVWLAMLLVAALLNVVILGFRVKDVVQHSEIIVTTGLETQPITAIWRVQTGRDLYAPPLSFPHSTALYNAGFYHFYAHILHLLGIEEARIPIGGRLLTLLWALVGCIGFFALLRLLASDPARPATRAENLVLAVVAGVTWFGSHFISWWTLAVRPDTGAMAMATWGLWLWLRWGRNAGWGGGVACALLFAGAWSFKQTAVAGLCGCVMAGAWFRQWKPLLGLCGSFAAIVTMAFMFGGKVYFDNVIWSPSLNIIHWRDTFHRTAMTIITNPFALLGFVMAGTIALRIRRGDKSASKWLPVLLALAVALPMNVIAVGREGGSRNYYFETYLLLSAMAGILLLRVAHAQVRFPQTMRLMMTAALLCLILFPAAQLVMFNRFGRVTQGTPEYVARMSDLLDAARHLPTPIFSSDELLSLPWHSSKESAEHFAPDSCFLSASKRRGLLPPDLLESLLRERYFGGLVLHSGNHLVPVALRAGYTMERELTTGWIALRRPDDSGSR